MAYIAFRVFYLGHNYQGYQRQLNGQTVENHIELAFIKSNLIRSFQDNDYQGSSRTDMGVNAISNTFVLQLTRTPNLMLINSFLPDDILIWSYANVNADFNLRSKVQKHYCYYLPKSEVTGADLHRLLNFRGRYDFTPFIKKNGAGMNNPISTITSIRLQETDDYYRIDIEGDKFGREQIRRMIGFVLEDKYKDISPTTVLDNGDRMDIHAASGENLFLLDVHYEEDIDWISVSPLRFRVERLLSFLENKIQHLDLINHGIDHLQTHLIKGSHERK